MVLKQGEGRSVHCACSNTKFTKVVVNAKSKKRSDKFNKIISWLAGISLVTAFAYGYFFNQPDFSKIISNQLKNSTIELVTVEEYRIKTQIEGQHAINYVPVREESGYGGPLNIGPVIDQNGIIKEILIIDHKETHSFINKLKVNNFFTQFEGKHIKDPILIHQDIDAVGGATISSVAISNAVKIASHSVGSKYFDIQYAPEPINWQLTSKDMIAAVIVILAIMATYVRKKWLRNLTLGVSLVFLGFYFNAAINVTHFGRLLLGFLPPLMDNIYWYILLFGSVIFPFFLKKNIYCNTMCPFHAVQAVMIKIGGMKVKFTPEIQKIAKHSSKFLLWLALMIIFISRNPTLASYEPFAMIFGLEGEGIQWYILPFVLIGVLLIRDYFCRYFCPVGQGFKYLMKFRKWIDSVIALPKTSNLKKINT